MTEPGLTFRRTLNPGTDDVVPIQAEAAFYPLNILRTTLGRQGRVISNLTEQPISL